MLFMGAVSHPHEVSYVVGIINPVFYIFYELMLQMFGSDFQFPLVTLTSCSAGDHCQQLTTELSSDTEIFSMYHNKLCTHHMQRVRLLL